MKTFKGHQNAEMVSPLVPQKSSTPGWFLQKIISFQVSFQEFKKSRIPCWAQLWQYQAPYDNAEFYANA